MEEKNVLDKPVFTWFISLLIFYSLFCFSFGTLPNLSLNEKKFLRYSEVIVTIIFTLEYIARIVSTKKRLKFIFSFYGLVDLIAILPFYLAFAVDLRTLRIIRLLRLARILKLVRYNEASFRFAKALYSVKEELVIFLLTSMMLIYIAGLGIYYFEHEAQPDAFRSIFDCLWWAVITLTTVGYGDIYPITVGGRIFTFVLLIIGLGLIAIPTGIISSALTSIRGQDNK
ncbi:ion transporter [Marinomonas lutimaris]|uniref:ion transporter n=1 Tax=Marinomonas lutimaris TaxID=2846746 RepID=UPI001C68231A|nr:ion transporter [Marinomonas lutimaris]